MGIPYSRMVAEFPEEDVDLLIALQRWENDRGQYGESLSEATSDAADPNGDGLVRYHAKYRVNHAQAAVQRRQDELKDDPDTFGRVWYVERKEYAPPVGG